MTIRQLSFFVIATLVGFTAPANADIVSTSLNGDTYAMARSTVDADFANGNSANFGSLASQGNAAAVSALYWSLAGNDLVVRSTILEQKSTNSGGTYSYYGTSTFDFEFTIDRAMDYSIAGNWGLSQAIGTNDLLSYSLFSSTSGVLFSNSTRINTGLNTQSFQETGVLSAGTYIFTMDALLQETMNRAQTRGAGWDLTLFRLTNVATVPEPEYFGVICLLGALFFARTKAE